MLPVYIITTIQNKAGNVRGNTYLVRVPGTNQQQQRNNQETTIKHEARIG